MPILGISSAFSIFFIPRWYIFTSVKFDKSQSRFCLIDFIFTFLYITLSIFLTMFKIPAISCKDPEKKALALITSVLILFM